MRRLLALAQLAGFAVVLGAVVNPAPRRILRHWPDTTIYPTWAPVLIAVGAAAAAVSLLARARAGRLLAVAATMSASVAAPLFGLGVWAHEHWVPAFGFGGTFPGGAARLTHLAVPVAIAAAWTGLAALGQLVVQGDLPRRGVARRRPRLVLAAAALAVAGPVAISVSGGAYVQDLQSLGALTLVHGLPWGLALAITGWLSVPGSRGVLTASGLAAVLFAMMRSTQLYGAAAAWPFLAVGALFAVALVAGLPLSADPDG